MSAANVTFTNIEGGELGEGEKPACFSFRCVRWSRDRHPAMGDMTCDGLIIAEGPHSAAHGIKRDPQGNNGGRPQWIFDGNREAPTFEPSINCEKVCGWHGYIRAGRCVDQQGKDEPD